MNVSATVARRLTEFANSVGISAEGVASHIDFWKEKEVGINQAIYSAMISGEFSTEVGMGTLSGSLWAVILIFLEDRGYIVEPGVPKTEDCIIISWRK
jgi:hypothetical protein